MLSICEVNLIPKPPEFYAAFSPAKPDDNSNKLNKAFKAHISTSTRIK